jgi:hypothetical protein
MITHVPSAGIAVANVAWTHASKFIGIL